MVDRIPGDEESVRRLIGRFPDRRVLSACYEAGPGGYELHRLLTWMGVACDVVAPSLIPTGSSIGSRPRGGTRCAGADAPGGAADAGPGAVPGRGGGPRPGARPRGPA